MAFNVFTLYRSNILKMIIIDDEVRIERLIARHIRYGKTPEEAENWSRGSDEANARFIELTAHRASGIIKLG